MCLIPGGVLLRGDQRLIQIDESYVEAVDGGGWAVGNSLVRYTLSRQGATVGLSGITDVASGRDWSRSKAPEAFITINDQRITIGSSVTPLLNVTTSEWWGGVRLDLHYRIAAYALDITRTYAVYPASSVIEVWTTYQAGARQLTLSDLNDYAFSVENGTMKWVSGLGASDDEGGPFTVRTADLDNNQTFEIGSTSRASENNVPWYSIVTPDQQFFGAVVWSGSWQVRATRHGDAIDLQAGLPTFKTTLGARASLETPHAIFGITTATTPEVSMALKGYIDHALRHGRPYNAYVSYNTWYSYGTFLDAASLTAEMDLAAAAGAEQFVVDAGWWPSPDGDPAVDFVYGWGTYQVDMDRFPDGLSALSDHAHQLGMRFGLWVEPERVDLNTINQPGGAAERFLAMRDGRYDPATPNSQTIAAQVCFVVPEARQWVTGRLVELIDAVHPDYLKWDNNFWINCNRTSHGHTVEDANFLHTRGVDMVRDDLRARYPDLEIEDCSSGANRLSLDMLMYSDASWLSDRTAPSDRVRHDLEGLLDIFPAPYLLTFAVTTDTEPMADNGDGLSDVPVIMRSRLPGRMGLSVRLGDMSDGSRAAMGKQIDLYKRVRPILANSVSFVLGPQQVSLPDTPWTGWDVIEHVSTTSGDTVLMAFETADAPSSTLVRLKGLKPDVMYQVESADYGDLGAVSGSDLMLKGVEIAVSDLTRSHVIILHAQPAAPPRLFVKR
ncbi:MAG TPA: alpha-galactosidase [Vicinamibacterales bacterium]|nr:alpha-galactosidase [Vicinamibacterales bacterium]